MSTRRHTGPWGKVINGALIGPAVSFGLIVLLVGIASVAQSGGLGFFADVAGVVLAVQMFALALGFPIALTIGIFKDASAIRRSKIQWSPSPVLYALGNFFVPLVGLHYLWKRYKYIPEPTHERVWWYLSVALFVLVIGAVVAPIVGLLLLSSSSSASSGGLFVGGAIALFASILGITIGIVFLPVAVYMDARHLHAKAAREGREPINPVNYFIGLPFVFILPIPLLGGLIGFLYYANKRRKIAGLR